MPCRSKFCFPKRMCRSSGANPLALTARETSWCRWDSIFMTWICLGRLNLQFSRIRCVCNFCETKREKFGHFCTLWFKFLCSRSKILGSYFLTCPKHVWQRRFAAIKAERASTCSNPIKLNTFSQHLLLLHFVFAKKKLAGNPPLPTFSFRSVFLQQESSSAFRGWRLNVFEISRNLFDLTSVFAKQVFVAATKKSFDVESESENWTDCLKGCIFIQKKTNPRGPIQTELFYWFVRWFKKNTWKLVQRVK